MIELLAPAGDKERLEIALLYGADAVYFGGQNYSLRANAQNFSLEDIKYAADFAHKLNKRVYVAVNIIFHNEDLTGLKDYLIKLDEIGIDAVIASDITVVSLINEINAKYEIHLSTQASTLNYEAVNFWKKLNVKRVVMARESSKENIERIKKETGVDIECFVHGAMCTSFSGKCVLSNYVTNRDSNRGGCAQICRWLFNTSYEGGPKFSIMPKDLNMINNISSMIDIGVNSFKIEGRMRSIYYIATVVLMYRNIIDKILNGTIDETYEKYALNILNRCANRDSKEQFYNSFPGVEEQYFLDRDESSNQDFLALVLENQNAGLIKVEQRNYFKIGDVVEIFGPTKDAFSFKISELYDEYMNIIDIARHPKMICYIKCPVNVTKYDMMRLKVFDKK